jgi:hypothetical protein
MKSFSTIRSAVALMMALLGLSLLLTGGRAAFAQQPLSTTLEINETDSVVSMCDFPLEVHQEGSLRTTLFFDEQTGQVTRITENWQDVSSTLTNPANGLSVTYRNAGHDGFTFEQDGTVKVYTQGVRGLITVPGSGAVFGEAGNVTARVDADGQPEITVSGFHWDGDASAVCDYLRGTGQP